MAECVEVTYSCFYSTVLEFWLEVMVKIIDSEKIVFKTCLEGTEK